MMETAILLRGGRARGNGAAGRHPPSRNRQWVAGHVADADRGGHRGGARGRGRGGGGGSVFHQDTEEDAVHPDAEMGEDDELEDDELVEDSHVGDDEPELETIEQVREYKKQLNVAREAEKKKAMAEGKMDDPTKPKRLEDAICMVGTCMDMCPRYERYVRWAENGLDKWELIPGTNRLDHKRAVKRYVRATGDQSLPSDLRPPEVLRKTLDYLFHELLPRAGFSETHAFVRDRSRAVRNDFTIQHETGPIAIECHDRCARFHILALHYEGPKKSFALSLQEEERQLMYTLQSLKEFYEDNRGKYQSPTEVEMRIYHRLIHIRDQKERRDGVTPEIERDEIFRVVTRFRKAVQRASVPITKTSALNFEPALDVFNELVAALGRKGDVAMIFLVMCILDHVGWKDVKERVNFNGDVSIPHIIDGKPWGADAMTGTAATEDAEVDETEDGDGTEGDEDLAISVNGDDEIEELETSAPPAPASTFPASSPFGSAPAAPVPVATPGTSVFANLASTSTTNVFGGGSAFGGGSVFGGQNVFGGAVFGGTTPSTSPSPFAGAGDASKKSAFSSSSAPPAAGPFSQTAGSTTSFFGQSSAFTAPTPSPPPMGPPPTSTTPFASAPATSAPSAEPSITPGATGQPNLFSTAKSNLNPGARVFSPSPLKTPLFTAPSPTSDTAQSPASAPILGKSKSSTDEKLAEASTSQSPAAKLVERAQTIWDIPTSSSKPTPPKLDTINLTPSLSRRTSEIIDGPRTPLTPSQQPALGRRQPMALPSTPQATLLEESFTGTKKMSGSLGSFVNFPKLGSLGSFTSTSGMLSPLIPSTPSTSKLPPPPLVSPAVQPADPLAGALQFIPGSPVSDKARGKQRADADGFVGRGLLVRGCFERWRERATDRAEWREAVKRSEVYKERVQRERMSASVSVMSDRGPTPSVGGSERGSPTRRVRRRVKSEYKKALTDEELAKRLRENKEEHERRWAQSTFVESVRAEVKGRLPEESGVPPAWRVWLSMNPDNDNTAIWLEKKFDVPESGEWVQETVFSIPLAPERAKAPALVDSPGIVVFECTPLEGLDDDLDRKYRALDDCTRLRELVESLPEDRHVAPALVVIQWAEGGALPADLVDMISKWVQDETLRSWKALQIAASTKDLDGKFKETLASLDLDTGCARARSLDVPGLFEAVVAPVQEFARSWFEQAASGEIFHWQLYGEVLRVYIDLLDATAHLVLDICSSSAPDKLLPTLSRGSINDSDTAYTTLSTWLGAPSLRDAVTPTTTYITARRRAGADFPAEDITDRLCELTQLIVESASKNRNPTLVPKSKITSALRELRATVEDESSLLRQFAASHRARCPAKRPAPETPTLGANGHKRFKGAMDESPTKPTANGTNHPPWPAPMPASPALSTVSDDLRPTATVAMLRALTKDLKRKYGDA